jgi:signal transduction histidine kinase
MSDLIVKPASTRRRSGQLPDESIAAEILPPLLVLNSLIAAVSFGLIFLYRWTENTWPYVLALLYVGSIWLASHFMAQRRLQDAGRVMAYALTFLPILSLLAFEPAGNYLIFLAPLGILLSATLISPEATFSLAWLALLTLLALLGFMPDENGTSVLISLTGLSIALTMVMALFGSAGLAWVAANSVRGTIGWALETSSKSERRENLLRATQRELEQAVHERDLLNDRLHKLNRDLDTARADAETAFRSKSSFMATMSHELRTPLNIIIGFSSAMIDHPEMYNSDGLPEILLTDLADIRRSGQHLLGLINDILDLARIEAGRLELNKNALPLIVLLDEMMGTARGLIKEQPILLRREYQSPLPSVFADEVRVRQVLLNLISNACKFTSAGEIAIGARAQDDEVIIWVRDTGLGIAEADQARVFRTFEQVGDQDTRLQGGTGLGLAICRWLVEIHGGKMWLQSELGKGSIFFFTLPRIRSELNGAQHESVSALPLKEQAGKEW